jgi:hypothetical protein
VCEEVLCASTCVCVHVLIERTHDAHFELSLAFCLLVIYAVVSKSYKFMCSSSVWHPHTFLIPTAKPCMCCCNDVRKHTRLQLHVHTRSNAYAYTPSCMTTAYMFICLYAHLYILTFISWRSTFFSQHFSHTHTFVGMCIYISSHRHTNFITCLCTSYTCFHLNIENFLLRGTCTHAHIHISQSLLVAYACTRTNVMLHCTLLLMQRANFPHCSMYM